jgi:hypothetical protein
VPNEKKPRQERARSLAQSSVPQKLFQGHADVFGDLPQEHGRDISAGMIRNRGAAPVGVAILHVRPALADESETQRLQNMANLPRL